MDDALVVYVTVPDEHVGASIARAVVEERLAACVNMVPAIRSFYRWKGQIEEDGESLLFMKTTAEAFPRLRERIVALHPYDVPCVTAWPITAAHEPYTQWIREEVAPRESPSD